MLFCYGGHDDTSMGGYKIIFRQRWRVEVKLLHRVRLVIFFKDTSFFNTTSNCVFTVKYRITALTFWCKHYLFLLLAHCWCLTVSWLFKIPSNFSQIFRMITFFSMIWKKNICEVCHKPLLPTTLPSTRSDQVCSTLSVRVSSVMHGFNKRSMVPGWNSVSFRGRWSLQCTWGEEGQLPFYKLGVCILGLSVAKHWGDKLFGMWSSANMIGVQWSSDGAASGMGFDYARSWLLNQ